MSSEILYISPVIPALTGNGLAMRAGMVLEALAARHSVSLLVKRLYPPAGGVPEFFARMCRRVAVDSNPYRRQSFDVIHVFRLASLPAAQPFLRGLFRNRRAKRHLDLDDIESETHRRLASLCASNADTRLAAHYEQQAAASQALEADAFAHFDRIYVCSELDRGKLAPRTAAEICVLPNSVRPPDETPPRPIAGPLLFVGTLGYYPNQDACRYLAAEIAPHLPDFRFHIVGTGVTEQFRTLVAHPAIRVIGEVPDVAPWYHNASAVVVPVRGGGGTRIKILEAFAHRRPVITTRIGAEGIDARHDEHLLIADTAQQFAEACRRMRGEPDVADRLVENAFSLLNQSYSAEATRRTIDALSWPSGR